MNTPAPGVSSQFTVGADMALYAYRTARRHCHHRHSCPTMLLPALAKAKQKAQADKCMSNLKQVSLLAVHQYTGDYNELFPPSPDDSTHDPRL